MEEREKTCFVACLTLNMVDTKLSLCLSWSNEYF